MASSLAELLKPRPVSATLRPGDFGKIAVYGDPGIGKTSSLTTFPKPLLLINFTPGGTSVLARVEGIDVIDLTAVPHAKAIAWLRQANNQLKAGQVGLLQPDKYTTVVIDDYSGLMDIAMQEAMNSGIKKATVAEMPTLQHYSAESSIAGSVVAHLLSASSITGQLAVVIFHTLRDYDDATGAVIQIAPLIRGKRDKLLKQFNEVYYMGQRTKLVAGKPVSERYWQTQPVGKVYAKSRLHAHWPDMPVETKPDFGPMWAKIQEVVKRLQPTVEGNHVETV